jgi:cyclopropane fatty-acyl-phospholipid synthase-like methyltransferase
MKAMILSHPALYQAYQNAGGFFGARIKAIADYLTLRPGMRVIDIGCGPGHILRHLPDDIEYTGFDIDEAYISYAKRSFGHLGTFHCRHFDAAAAREFAGADVVMMNGVLHHIADDGLQATLTDIRDVLKNDGVLFTLDGCYRQGQSRIAKWLLDNDRGEFIRDEDGYNKVLGNAFARVKLAIREDLSRLPYTFAIGVMQK